MLPASALLDVAIFILILDDLSFTHVQIKDHGNVPLVTKASVAERSKHA